MLLLPPFQGLQQPPRFTHQCQLHTFVGLPACHCYWAAGKFYELFKSPLCCCQILPPPASPSHNWTVSVNCVNNPSQRPGHHFTLPLTGHIVQSTPKLINSTFSVSPEFSHAFLPLLPCPYFRPSGFPAPHPQ